MAEQNKTPNNNGGAPGAGTKRPPGGMMGGPGRGGPMGGPMGGMGTGEKPKSFKKSMGTFLKYLAPYRPALIVVLIFAIASTVFSIIGPKLLGNAVTRLFVGIVAKATHVPGAGIDFDYIGRICLILLGLYVASFIFSYFLNAFLCCGCRRATICFCLRRKAVCYKSKAAK